MPAYSTVPRTRFLLLTDRPRGGYELLDHQIGPLADSSATTLDHPLIADFLATTGGLGGASSPPIPAMSPSTSTTYIPMASSCCATTRPVRGYAALRTPHGDEQSADFVFDQDTPPNVVDEIVESTVARFHAETSTRRRLSYG